MNKYLLFTISILPLMLVSLFIKTNNKIVSHIEPIENIESRTIKFENYIEDFYFNCNMQGKLSFDAFRYAIIGYYNLECKGSLERNDLITIIDYTKSSNKKRLFVVDVNKKQIILNSLVAHGKNTGDEFAKYFSNTPRSQKSSIGFFVTGETYDGKHKYSLKIDGLEYTNSNVRNRGVVFHGADYVDESYTKHSGRIGRSNGCPALPQKENEKIVNKIKGGSCLFIYYPDEKYFDKSNFLDFGAALQQFNIVFN